MLLDLRAVAPAQLNGMIWSVFQQPHHPYWLIPDTKGDCWLAQCRYQHSWSALLKLPRKMGLVNRRQEWKLLTNFDSSGHETELDLWSSSFIIPAWNVLSACTKECQREQMTGIKTGYASLPGVTRRRRTTTTLASLRQRQFLSSR